MGTTLSWHACLCSLHLLYIVSARQGPTTQLGWAPPTREPSQGPDSVVGPSRWRSILTFSPLISTLYFRLLNLNVILYFLFTCFALGPCLIADQYIGLASSRQLSDTVRLTATMHLSVLKQDLNLSLGPFSNPEIIGLP